MKSAVLLLLTFLLLLWGPDDTLRAFYRPVDDRLVIHQEVFPVAVRCRLRAFEQLRLPVPGPTPSCPRSGDRTPALAETSREQRVSLDTLSLIYRFMSLRR